jgi:hypothetical protein
MTYNPQRNGTISTTIIRAIGPIRIAGRKYHFGAEPPRGTHCGPVYSSLTDLRFSSLLAAAIEGRLRATGDGVEGVEINAYVTLPFARPLFLQPHLFLDKALTSDLKASFGAWI